MAACSPRGFRKRHEGREEQNPLPHRPRRERALGPLGSCGAQAPPYVHARRRVPAPRPSGRGRFPSGRDWSASCVRGDVGPGGRFLRRTRAPENLGLPASRRRRSRSFGVAAKPSAAAGRLPLRVSGAVRQVPGPGRGKRVGALRTGRVGGGAGFWPTPLRGAFGLFDPQRVVACRGDGGAAGLLDPGLG